MSLTQTNSPEATSFKPETTSSKVDMNSEEFRKILAEGRIRAEAERKAKIDAAIESGASVEYITVPLSSEEQETIVISGCDSTTIDTTKGSDIVRYLKTDYPIKGVTYLGHGENQRVVGVRFEISGGKKVKIY